MPYDVHPGILMTQQWVAALKQKTGRSLEEWLDTVRREGPSEVKERRQWLKDIHGLGTNSALWIADRASGRGIEDEDPATYLRAAEEWVEAMFAGPKAALRPIFEDILAYGRALGDVRVCPGKTIIPFYRNHVFAQVKVSTRTRLDLGLALKDTPAKGRLIDTGGLAKKDRITHRIALSTPADFDDYARKWLRKAYDMDA